MSLAAIGLWGAGLGIVALLMWTRWPGWLGLPLVVLVARALLDVGFAVSSPAADIQPSPHVGAALPSEIWPSVGYILLSYAAIAVGLIGMWALWRIYGSSARPSEHTLPADVLRRAWQASRMAVWFGAAMQTASIAILLGSGSSLIELAQRAAFTNTEVAGNLGYGIARTFSAAMLVGSIGMIVFARSLRMRRWGIVAGIAHAAYEAMLGGRTRVVLTVIAILLAVVWTERRVTARTVVKLLIVPAVLLLGYVYIVRFEVPSPRQVVSAVVEDSADASRVNQMAFLLRNVPERIPHTGWAPLVAAGSHILPGIGLPGAENPWQTFVRVIYEGTNPFRGIGGSNFPNAGDSYLAFGNAGVIWLGLAYGAVFGFVFEWHRRHRWNPFAALLMIMVVIVFYSGVSARLPVGLGGLAVSFVLPIVVITAVALPQRLAWQASIATYVVLVGFLSFLLFRDTAMPYAGQLAQLARLGTMAALGALYLWGLRLLGRSEHLALEAGRGPDGQLVRSVPPSPQAALPRRPVA